MTYAEIMIEAAFEALEERRPFSCIETRALRYWGPK